MRRLWARAWCAMVVAAAIGFACAGTASAETPSGFTIVPGAPVGEAHLYSVDAAGPNAAWAVGFRGPCCGAHAEALIERWTGSRWAAVGLRTVGLGTLSDVVAGSPSSVWAVGATWRSDDYHGLLLHFNGSDWVTWAPPGDSRLLYEVAPRGHGDLYVLGTIRHGGECGLTRLWHWDGEGWATVADFPGACENGPGFGRMSTVAGGPLLVPGGYFDHETTYAPTFDCYGSGCPQTRFPFPGSDTDYWNGGFFGASALSSADDVWLAGWSERVGEQGDLHTLVVDHWDGERWSIGETGSYAQDHELADMVELTPGSLWAVGSRMNDESRWRTLIVHIVDGVPVDLGGPNPGAGSAQLSALAHVPGTATEMWAVGNTDSAPLILHHP